MKSNNFLVKRYKKLKAIKKQVEEELRISKLEADRCKTNIHFCLKDYDIGKSYSIRTNAEMLEHFNTEIVCFNKILMLMDGYEE